jgi:pyrrolidone-carboxylate peptidase
MNKVCKDCENNPIFSNLIMRVKIFMYLCRLTMYKMPKHVAVVSPKIINAYIHCLHKNKCVEEQKHTNSLSVR